MPVRTFTINAPIEVAWDVIADIPKYPEFLKELKAVRIDKIEGNVKTATYEVEIVKKIEYTLKLVEEKPRKVTWSMVKGQMMSRNDGSWQLRDLGGGKTEATYTVDVKFGLLVPSAISNMLTEVNLPKMLDAFKNRIEARVKR